MDKYILYNVEIYVCHMVYFTTVSSEQIISTIIESNSLGDFERWIKTFIF